MTCLRGGLSLIVVLATLLLLMSLVGAQPHHRDRRSGISDQRLAELETLMALAKMRNRVRTGPVAFGLIDPSKLGKRKRSYDVAEEYPTLEQYLKDSRQKEETADDVLDEGGDKIWVSGSPRLWSVLQRARSRTEMPADHQFNK